MAIPKEFFSPQSVAVIGASRHPGKIGHEILWNFARGFYKGRIFPINPNSEKILGLRCYRSVLNVREKIDLAIIAVKAETVPSVLTECMGKKIPAVIVISGGFSELGPAGKLRENELQKIVAGTNTRLIGPNCVGVFDAKTNVDTLFLSKSRLLRPHAGNISFISQSGAVGTTILDWLAESGIGISKFISYGNQADIDETDLLEFLASDNETKVIAAYIEGLKSGRKFMQIAKKVSGKKQVIFLKAGKTKKGSQAASSHTGSLAGSAEIYSGAFKQTGILEAGNWEELFDFAKAFASQPLPASNRLAVITDGGGFGVLAADEAERQNFELPEPSKKLKLKFKGFPSYASLKNPIDLTGDADAERYKIAVESCLKSDEFDAVLVILLFQVPTLEKSIDETILALSRKYNKTIVACAAGSHYTQQLVRKLEAGGIPVYPTPERAVGALRAMLKYKNFKV
ncbi:MAG: CoA-binding protein [DPANN group archaeon]|nr:CoA-binding protein [DPANN group archaeon]